MTRRTWLAVLVVVIGGLLAADWAYWRAVTQGVHQSLAQWEANLRAEGWEIEAGPLTDRGWPLTAAVEVANLALRHGPQAVPGSVAVSAPGATISVSLLRPDKLELRLQTPLLVRLGEAQELVLAAEQLAVTAGLLRSGPPTIALQGRDLRLQTADGAWHAAAHELLIDVMTHAPPDGTEPPGKIADFRLRANGITLPSDMRWALGQTVSSLQAQGAVHGSLPPSRPIAQWAADWRNNGGSVELSRVAVNWGPLAVTASATLALDEQLQPMGTGSARLSGYAQTLDRFAAAGLLTRSAATAAKALLSLMAGIGEGDGPSTVDVPLVLQYRTLFMRQVPLVRFPDLDWPTQR